MKIVEAHNIIVLWIISFKFFLLFSVLISYFINFVKNISDYTKKKKLKLFTIILVFVFNWLNYEILFWGNFPAFKKKKILIRPCLN
jgi:hypothetical protein